MHFKSSGQSTRKAYLFLLAIILLLLLQPKGGTWAWLENVRWFYVLLVSFFLAQLFVPLSEKIAWRFKILDYPDGARKLHTRPIPRIGGLAVFLAVLLSTLRNYQFSSQLTGLMLGSSLVYCVGFLDDIRPLPALTRLLAQIAASLAVVGGGITVSFIPNAWPAARLLEAAITVVWLIGITNAINFMDGVDGLAASMCVVFSLFFFLIAWPTRQSYLSYLTIAVAGACLGFLPYNWRPASVFLGDAGSNFLGFLVAGLAVMGSWAHDNPTVAFSTPLLILGIPIFDMIYTTVSRIRNGSVRTVRQWLEFAGRDHFHHRLLHLRLNAPQTVLFILMVNVCLGLAALVIRDSGTRGSLLLLLQSVIIFMIIVVLMLLGRDTATSAVSRTDAAPKP